MADEVKTLLNWNFPEYPQHHHSRGWWISFAIIGVALIIFAILSANFLFALIIIMAAAIILYRHYQEPNEIEFQIIGRGLMLSERLYAWRELDRFWLAYDPPYVKTLVVMLKSSVRGHLSIPLMDQDPLQVRDILGKYLEEDLDQDSEPFSDTLGRILRI